MLYIIYGPGELVASFLTIMLRPARSYKSKRSDPHRNCPHEPHLHLY